MSDEQKWDCCPDGMLKGVQRLQKSNDDGPVMLRRTALGVVFAAGTAFLVTSLNDGELIAQEISCRAALQLAPDYIDGKLGEQDEINLVAHLKDCPSCDKKVKAMQAAAGLA